jgi:membrane protein YdbS with pleckstrin-like domain
MYNSFRQTCERLLRIPRDPEPPPGDEASAQLFRAAPNFYKYLLFIWALKTAGVFLFSLVPIIAPIVGAMVLVKKGNDAGWFLLLIPGAILTLEVGFLLFALALVRLDFEKRWYLVTDRSLRVREGVAIIREMTVTFANIQNISISQGPIQRALGIADLRVDTAGGGGGGGGQHGQQIGRNLHTAWFRGVNNANEVRELIQQRLRHFKDSGLGDHEEFTASMKPPATSHLVPVLRELCAEARALRETVSGQSLRNL